MHFTLLTLDPESEFSTLGLNGLKLIQLIRSISVILHSMGVDVRYSTVIYSMENLFRPEFSINLGEFCFLSIFGFCCLCERFSLCSFSNLICSSNTP